MPTNIAVSGISGCNSVLFVTTSVLNPPVSFIKKQIARKIDIDECGYYLVHDGRVLGDNDEVDTQDNSTISVNAIPRLLGGKGGFGSLIRAMGKSTQKSQNTEACRDLSGRRMRDVSTEKKLAQWIKDAAEKKKVAEEEKKARRERRRAGPKHIFNDVKYMNQIEANAENISDALKQGLAASSGTKRPCAGSEPTSSKKLHLWSGVGDLSDEELSNNEERGEDEDDNSSNSSKSDNGNRIVASSTTQQLKTDTSSDDEIKEDNSVVSNDQDVVETSSVTPPTETENISSDKEKSNDVAEEKTKDDIIHSSTNNITDSTANVNGNETGAAETSKTEEATFEPIDLEKYATAEELTSAVTPEHLKFTLQQLGLKCGGTPAQRGERLFATKGKSLGELDPSMFVKSKKQKKQK